MFDPTTIAKAPRRALDDIASMTWRALAAGSIDETTAATLSEAVEARRLALRAGSALRSTGKLAGARETSVSVRHLPAVKCALRPPLAPQKREKIERRRRLAASGPMPPALAAKFTTAELAALRIVADEVRDRGICDRTLDEIAARAGCSRSTVRNSIRAAREHRLLDVNERRVPGRRNLPNLITIVSAEWLAWLKRGPRRERGDRAQEIPRLTDNGFLEGARRGAKPFAYAERLMPGSKKQLDRSRTRWVTGST